MSYEIIRMCVASVYTIQKTLVVCNIPIYYIQHVYIYRYVHIIICTYYIYVPTYVCDCGIRFECKVANFEQTMGASDKHNNNIYILCINTRPFNVCLPLYIYAYILLYIQTYNILHVYRITDNGSGYCRSILTLCKLLLRIPQKLTLTFSKNSTTFISYIYMLWRWQQQYRIKKNIPMYVIYRHRVHVVQVHISRSAD